MFKKSLSAVLLTAFTASVLSACGTTQNTLTMPVIDATQQDTTVGALSYSGVKKEIEKSLTAQFKALDADKNKMITPEEYGVKSPDEFTAFAVMDDNKDGKVTLKEMLPGFFSKIGMALRLQKAAGTLFGQLDRNKDKFVQAGELENALVSTEFLGAFKKYDKEKKIFLFRKANPGKLSKSEFENMYAHIAMSGLSNVAAPAPVEPPPAAPADPATPPA